LSSEETFAHDDAFLAPAAVMITVVTHPARAAVRNAGAAYNGTHHTANDRARRSCDNGSRACSDCRAGEGSFLRIRRYGKGG
jgi:hypothetical protein